MSRAIILALCVVIALMALSHEYGVQPVIEDTTLHHAAYREGPPLLFAPCQPIPPRNFPRWMERKA